MTNSTATFGQTTFEAGWTKYVMPPLASPQTVLPDGYWNPRSGEWATYTSTLNDIQDKGWPKVDLSWGYALSPSKVYDQISDQYKALASEVQPAAFWDPRRRQWMSIHKRDGDDKFKALNSVLERVVDLHSRGYIRASTMEEIITLINHEK